MSNFMQDRCFKVAGRDGYYSETARGWVDEPPAGATVAEISFDDFVATARLLNLPPYHSVSPYRIVRRLEAAGLAQQALAVIEAPDNAVLKARFYTLAGVGGIPADDPDAIALVKAAGADPDVILAPE